MIPASEEEEFPALPDQLAALIEAVQALTETLDKSLGGLAGKLCDGLSQLDETLTALKTAVSALTIPSIEPLIQTHKESLDQLANEIALLRRSLDEAVNRLEPILKQLAPKPRARELAPPLR